MAAAREWGGDGEGSAAAAEGGALDGQRGRKTGRSGRGGVARGSWRC